MEDSPFILKMKRLNELINKRIKNWHIFFRLTSLTRYVCRFTMPLPICLKLFRHFVTIAFQTNENGQSWRREKRISGTKKNERNFFYTFDWTFDYIFILLRLLHIVVVVVYFLLFKHLFRLMHPDLYFKTHSQMMYWQTY